MSAGYKWRPLQRSEAGYFRPELIAMTAKQYAMSEAEALALLEREQAKGQTWVNDLYQVLVTQLGETPEGKPIFHINIRRRDGAPCIRDWRHFQQIKNEVLGSECEAVELYPAESRKVDAANKYHLYGVKDPTWRFPIGMEERDVQHAEHRNVPGMRQRPNSMGSLPGWEEGHGKADAELMQWASDNMDAPEAARAAALIRKGEA